MESQLNILSESLDKKVKVLQEIQEYNIRQEKAFQGEQIDMEQFDDAIEEKDQLIEKLMKLDEGFETLYHRISEELQDNREKYAVQIREIQGKISQVMELSMSVQAQEARNKKLVEDYFQGVRRELHQNKQSSKAAYDYYKSMSGAGYRPSQFPDSKQ